MLTIELPWPPKALSPNGRAHHMAKARSAKIAREYAWGVVLEALHGVKPNWPKASLHWEFHPKTANLPDEDNAEAACKAYRDGIADALGLDDKHFKATRSIEAPVKGGSVLVTISEAK